MARQVQVKDVNMEHFLIFSGALAMIVGLLAVIEGHLGCLGHMRRKKDLPKALRRTHWGTSALKYLRILWH